MISGKNEKAFKAFYESARHNTILAEDTTVVLHLATALAFGCSS
jgi:hypothetical protein